MGYAGVVPAAPQRLPPTSPALLLPETRPYFIWWMGDLTIGQLREHLRDPDPDLRAYRIGVVLREAIPRDVWLFTTPDEIRAVWPHVLKHLGRRREMWAWLLDMKEWRWPPPPDLRGAYGEAE